MKFVKYHGLGNDYLVIEPEQFSIPPDPAQIRQVCDRHYGPGSDGILLGPLPTDQAEFGLRIYNPDGSLAEKSGNGLRIFSRYLWDCQRLKRQDDHSLPFTIHTPGGVVRSQVLENGRIVNVEMGQASFDSQRVPVSGPARQAINESMLLEGREYHYCAVSMGNPHCVILYDLTLQQDPQAKPLSEELARRLGPLIENEPRFPQRINVQFLQVIDRGNLRIEIWERGAGYTLASGSSSCAATAAAYRMGWCDSQITMHMPGGRLQISISPQLDLTMRGPVEKVYEGWIDEQEEMG